jgi:divalent metal cation (Fe/Co/Zn/Cd) transporter
MNLENAHNLASEIEANLRNTIGNAEITIHTEPLKAEVSTEDMVKKIATEVEGVKEAHKITAVYTDGKLFVTLHARVDPKLSIQDAHKIAGKIEDRINAKISEVENVTVHIEPFSAKVRKFSELDENEIRKIVSNTLEDFPQTVRCKRIVTYIAGKNQYINIDCSFTSQITIEEAHKIASLIEKNIRKQFAEKIVTVHTEPS